MIIKDIIARVKNYFKPVYSFVNAETNEIILSFDTIIEANIDSSSEICTVPIETGYRRTEYKYANPTSIEFKCYIQRSNLVANTLRDTTGISKNKQDLITETIRTLEIYNNYLIPINITTKSGFYKNYTLKSFYIPENFDNYNLFECKITFEEILTNQNEEKKYKNVFDKPTVNNGISQKVKI